MQAISGAREKNQNELTCAIPTWGRGTPLRAFPELAVRGDAGSTTGPPSTLQGWGPAGALSAAAEAAL